MASIQSQPDIAARIAFAHPKGVVEEADKADFVYAADSMDITGTNGQGVWQLLGPASRQPTNAMPPSQVGWRVGLTRGNILGAVPLQKRPLQPRHIAPPREMMSLPELLGPQGIEGLGRPVVIGFAQWREQDRNPDIETQAHGLADLASVAATTEGTLVVELGQVGNPQCFPRFEQVLASISRGFVSVDRGGHIVAVNVDGVESLDHRTPSNPPRNDIGGVDGIRILSWGMRTISLALARRWGGAVVAVENTLKGAQAGRWPIAVAIFALDRPRTDPGEAGVRCSVAHQVLAET